MNGFLEEGTANAKVQETVAWDIEGNESRSLPPEYLGLQA
jgi:hypothetical protein